MERNIVIFAGIVAALFISASLIASTVLAHMYDDQTGYEDSDFRGHHKEMLDLHKQYFNNEISYDEFADMMEKEMLEDGMPCFGG